MVYCRVCRHSYSERKGTVLEQSRLPYDKAMSLLNHARDDSGTLQIQRQVGVNKNTVTRYILLAGKHARGIHDEKVEISPNSREIQLDEKWGFISQKQKNVSPEKKSERGDDWDHVALDAENRLVLAVHSGKRTLKSCQKVISELESRTGGRKDLYLTSDEHEPWKKAIETVYSQTQELIVREEEEEETQKKLKKLKITPLDKATYVSSQDSTGLVYATVKKERKAGRISKVTKTLVFGKYKWLKTYLCRSKVSKTINTSFLERNNATDRHQNSRKNRKTYRFSKDKNVHHACSDFVIFSYNFCWPVRTLKIKNKEGGYLQRTPAMAAQLTDHVWSVEEWVTYPAKYRCESI